MAYHAGIVFVNNTDSGSVGTVAGNGGHIDRIYNVAVFKVINKLSGSH